LFMILSPPLSTLFPYTTLFRSLPRRRRPDGRGARRLAPARRVPARRPRRRRAHRRDGAGGLAAPTALAPPARRPRHHLLRRLPRSEEHTSELQSRENLVCRLLL